jgi:hypothetical protein
MPETETIAGEVQKALAVERQRERERTEAQQRKSERYKSEPSSYLRDQAIAADRAWELRIEQMYRTAEKQQVAEEKHAGELAEIASENTAIEKRHGQRLRQIEEDAERARAEAQAEYEADRTLVKRKQTELQQMIAMDAMRTEPGKRLFGFPRRKRGQK